jgi:hypothetical protein
LKQTTLQRWHSPPSWLRVQLGQDRKNYSIIKNWRNFGRYQLKVWCEIAEMHRSRDGTVQNKKKLAQRELFLIQVLIIYICTSKLSRSGKEEKQLCREEKKMV